MYGTLILALVSGGPPGTFIGQHFGWRESSLTVSLIGVIATVASIVFVQNNIDIKTNASIE